MNTIIDLLLRVPCILFATTLHEFVRAAVSTALGDKKPKNEGRLTINPVKHFEPIGFILFLATGFGWGQPVQTNALFYKNRKRDTLITAISPSVANLLAAMLFAILLRTTNVQSTVIKIILISLIQFNVSLAVYNIVPITPMDGLKVLSTVMPANTYFSYIQYEKIVQMLFLFLLFLGRTDVVFSPIIRGIMSILGL
ncbi:MAG: site-2 protease family protein [Lachnospiraceae bacterium]|nr:site-2 protease family protein [Lachnospiraceae bacterium]